MRRCLVIPVIAGLLVTLGACGAKEETATSTGASPTTTQQASTSTAGDSSDAGGGDSDGGIGDLPAGVDQGCIQVSALMMQSIVLVNPGASSEDFDKLEVDLEAAKDDMPAEIADAFDTWSAAWVAFGADMEEVNANGGFSNPENISKMEEANVTMEAPEVQAASDQLEQYIEGKCVTGN